MRVLALIPARAGSKGLRHKNVRPLHGVPLLVRAVRLARRSRRPGEAWRIVVSTDSPRYERLARQAGAEVLRRPARLASDRARLIDAVLHAVDAVGDPDGKDFDVVLLLSATTPLTTPRDVRGALDVFAGGGGVSVASVALDPVPAAWRFRLEDGVLQQRPRLPIGRRQEAPAAAVLNGALYAATPAWLRRYRQFVRAGRTLPFVMPPARCLDIETTADLKAAAGLLSPTRRAGQKIL